jgi:hypothetical protein
MTHRLVRRKMEADNQFGSKPIEIFEAADEMLSKLLTQIQNIHRKTIDSFIETYLSTFEIKTTEDLRNVMERIEINIATMEPNKKYVLNTTISVRLKDEKADGKNS